MSHLRPLRPTDLLNLASTNLDPLTETYHIGFYLEYLAKWPTLCRVLEGSDGEIEGYILAKVESSPHMQPTSSPYNPDTNRNPHYLPWHAHITALTIASAYRRLGHARKLTQYLEHEGDKQNCWFVDLYVRKDNTNALKLYESMGYSVFRVVKSYYGDGSDAFDMRKALKRDIEAGYRHVRSDGEEHEVTPDVVW